MSAAPLPTPAPEVAPQPQPLTILGEGSYCDPSGEFCSIP